MTLVLHCTHICRVKLILSVTAQLFETKYNGPLLHSSVELPFISYRKGESLKDTLVRVKLFRPRFKRIGSHTFGLSTHFLVNETCHEKWKAWSVNIFPLHHSYFNPNSGNQIQLKRLPSLSFPCLHHVNH